MAISRRKVLGWLGISAAVPLVSRGNTVAAYFQEMAPKPSDSPADLALKWIRMVNTAQMSYFQEFNKWASVSELPKAKLLRTRNAQVPPAPSGFESAVVPSADGYFVIIRNTATGHSYQSDNAGVIYEGTAAPLQEVLTRREKGNKTFDGQPIVRKGREQAVRATGPLSHVWGFFFPVLSAQDNDCPIGFGCGSCRSSCDCSEACCNWGTQSCTWCCSPSMCCDIDLEAA